MNQQESSIATHLSKVPQITALFWITKIFGGVSKSMLIIF